MYVDVGCVRVQVSEYICVRILCLYCHYCVRVCVCAFVYLLVNPFQASVDVDQTFGAVIYKPSTTQFTNIARRSKK